MPERPPAKSVDGNEDGSPIRRADCPPQSPPLVARGGWSTVVRSGRLGVRAGPPWALGPGARLAVAGVFRKRLLITLPWPSQKAAVGLDLPRSGGSDSDGSWVGPPSCRRRSVSGPQPPMGPLGGHKGRKRPARPGSCGGGVGHQTDKERSSEAHQVFLPSRRANQNFPPKRLLDFPAPRRPPPSRCGPVLCPALADREGRFGVTGFQDLAVAPSTRIKVLASEKKRKAACPPPPRPPTSELAGDGPFQRDRSRT